MTYDMERIKRSLNSTRHCPPSPAVSHPPSTVAVYPHHQVDEARDEHEGESQLPEQELPGIPSRTDSSHCPHLRDFLPQLNMHSPSYIGRPVRNVRKY